MHLMLTYHCQECQYEFDEIYLQEAINDGCGCPKCGASTEAIVITKN